MGAGRGRRVLFGVVLAATVTAVGVSPVAADTNLIVGGHAVVSHTNNGVNVRATVGGKVLFALAEGAQVKVIGGPNKASDGSLWYNVDVNGTLGWIVSDYLSLPTTSAGDTVVISGTNGQGLRLRASANTSAATLVIIPEGASATVVGAQTTDSSGTAWAELKYNGQTGYASRDYLVVGGGSATVTANTAVADSGSSSSSSGIAVGTNAVVTGTDGDGLNLRSSASYSAGIITVANEGDVVHVIDGPVTADGDSWWGVDYSGMKGWMDASYLAVTDKSPTQAASTESTSSGSSSSSATQSTIGQQIVQEAMKFLGYPYVWGGTTPAGFDCSGFVYYVVNQVIGGGFPRAMDAQVTSGTYVSANDLQPGDIVFQQNTYEWGLSHAGIYIGGGKFINAANESTGVIISNLWDSYWGPRYYTARRIGG